MIQFYSHGKLLIAGEYLVMRGANALTTPVKFGQSLKVNINENSKNLIWESFEKGKLWFSAEFNPESLEILQSSNQKIAIRLQEILKSAVELRPGFTEEFINKRIVTEVNFNLNWGLGSSSSLISNIAWWADIDPFEIHKRTSSGSGFDIAAARANGPIFYKRTGTGNEVMETSFNPDFKDNIYFIYLGKKQDSSVSVEFFNRKIKKLNPEIQLISDLSKHIATAKRIDDFEYYIKEHELILSSILKSKTIKEERFSDLKGEVKSLGAWGGDFAMLTWHNSLEKLKNYLKTKNIETIFTFDELIKLQ